MRFKELFTGKSPLRLNGDKSNKLSYRQMEKDMVNAHWTKFKKDLDAGKYYSKTKPLTQNQMEREMKIKNPPQSGAIEITSGPETFFAGPGTKATGFVLKKGADLMKSKAAKVAKNLGKNIAGTYAEAHLGL
jgi:hypothetical protein